MKTAAQALIVASAFSAAFAQTSASTPIIQSPASLVVCQPALLSFSGGTAPYYISVLPGGNPSAAALEQFPTQNGNSYTWNVNLAAGQSITLAIRDSTGAINYSSELPIQAGTDTSCIGSSASGSGSSTPGAAATSGASNSLSSVSRVSVTTSGMSTSTISSSRSTSSSASSSGAAASVSSGASSVASGASSVAGSATSAAAAATSAVTGAGSKQFASIAAVVGAAGLAAFFA